MKLYHVLFFILLIPTLFFAAASEDKQPEYPFFRTKLEMPTNFYTFIGLDQRALSHGALNKVMAVMSDAEKEQVVNEHYAQEITKACTKKRDALQKDIFKATEALKQAQELDREKKAYELLQLQFQLNITKSICPLLLNPAQRAAHDEQLKKAVQQADEFFVAMQQAINSAQLLASDFYVMVNQVIGGMLAELIKDEPGPVLQLFNQQMEVRSISILPLPYGPEVRYGLGFSGLMVFGKSEVRVSIYVIQDIYGKRRASISIELPDHYKLSDLFPAITMLDTFSLPKAKLILSNFEGYDLDGFNFKRGLNYVALVDLKGPLDVLNALKEQSRYLKMLVFESKPIMLSGLINPYDFYKTSFSITVPLYFGIDVQQIPLMPTMISNVIQKITTDDLNITVLPFTKETVPTILPTIKTRIAAETGARITLGTQKDPIRLTLNGLLEPPSVNHRRGYLSFGGNIKNKIEFGWLAIGNATVQCDFDPALMEAMVQLGYPLPFTGLLVRGEIDLGKPGDARAQLKVAGGFRAMTKEKEEQLAKEIERKEEFSPTGQTLVELVAKERKKIAAKLPEVLFDVEADNIRFADLLSYTTKLAANVGLIKEQIPVTSFPSMTLHKVWGHLALVDTRIADKEYKAGLGLQVETEFWNQKAGFRVHILAPEINGKPTFQLSGWGYMPAIAINSRGKEVFRLHGIHADKGPRLAFLFNPQEPQKGHFLINGAVHIPGLGLKQAIDFRWYYWWLLADFESKFAGFSVVFGIRMNVKAKPPQEELVVPIRQVDAPEGKQEEEEFRAMTKKEEEVYTEFEKWRQLYIKFGFKDDFAEFLNEQLVTALRSLKAKTLEQLKRISLFIAQQQQRSTATVQQEIVKTEQEMVTLKQDIASLKAACSKQPRLQQIQCRASIAVQQARLQAKNFYKEALVRPFKGIVYGTTELAKRVAQAQAWRLATESILDGVSGGIELIAGGIKLLRVREAVGEYSYRDMIEWKLPRLVRLVIELNLSEEPQQIVLQNLQFDFKAAKTSCILIAAEIMQAYTRSQNKKIVANITQLITP